MCCVTCMCYMCATHTCVVSHVCVAHILFHMCVSHTHKRGVHASNDARSYVCDKHMNESWHTYVCRKHINEAFTRLTTLVQKQSRHINMTASFAYSQKQSRHIKYECVVDLRVCNHLLFLWVCKWRIHIDMSINMTASFAYSQKQSRHIKYASFTCVIYLRVCNHLHSYLICLDCFCEYANDAFILICLDCFCEWDISIWMRHLHTHKNSRDISNVTYHIWYVSTVFVSMQM